MRKLDWKEFFKRDEVFHIARCHINRSNPCRVHTHNFAELFWMESGDCKHMINGKERTLRSGDLILIRPGDRHGLTAVDEEGFTLVNLAFRANTISFLKNRYFPRNASFWGKSGDPAQFVLSPQQSNLLEKLLERLSAAPRTCLELERFLVNLLYELAQPDSSSLLSDCPDWLRHALNKIGEPSHFATGTRGLARLAGRCPEHVNRQLRKSMGTTATDVVNGARLEYAARQLTMTNRKIVDISLECGYHHLGHFYQLFGKRFKMTPRAYRLRNHGTMS